ncbi:F0F1 ATP synthase subunit delta [Metamycoplasma buccale]|uniref:F0F1 ATP synthase subunit delta n=1 Tax=Metamycoplasma buccale TaxID=55602 RepID=UPI00398F45E2
MKELNKIIYNWSFALFDLAEEIKQLKEMTNEVLVIHKTLKKNKKYLNYIDSFDIDLEDKYEKIDQAFGSYNKYIINFIKLAIKAHVAKYLTIIFNKFIELSNNKLNVKYGIIYSINPLEKKEIKIFEKQLSKNLNAEVHLVNELREELIAGIKIKVDDYIIENSIEDQLQKLEKYINKH